MTEALFLIKVMEPIRVEAQPVGEYLYQVKWDGMRWITYKSKQGTFFQTKAQKVFTARFAELDHGFNWLPPESMIDGEVVVLREGLPHFPSLLRRLHSRFLKLPELEVDYIIFDILFWKGRDWRNKPLSDRLELLEQCIPASERCQRIETFSDGAKLWKGIEQLGTRLGHISTPLLWDEVVQGVNPDDFHVRSFRERLKKVGDLSTVMGQNNDFSSILHYFT